MKPLCPAFFPLILAGLLCASHNLVAPSLLTDSVDVKTQPEEVTLLEQPRNDALFPGDSGSSSSGLENWKKWTPNGGYQEETRNSGWVTSGRQQKTTGRSNCSHFGSCHDCNRHGCFFMACGRRTVCINSQTYISWSGANRCNRIDKCSSHPKRNIQQLSPAAGFYQSPGLKNVGHPPLKTLRSNPHSRISNRYRNYQNPSSTSTTTASSRSERRDYETNYFSRSNYPNGKFSASHDSRPTRTRFSRMHQQQSPSLMSGRNMYPMADPVGSNTSKLSSLPSIGFGTIIALMICSSIVVSAVIAVAVKKLRKIYSHNKSMAYGTLEEDQ